MAKYILKNGDQYVEYARRVWRYSDKTGTLQRTIDLMISYTNKERKAQVFANKDSVEMLIATAKQVKDIDLYSVQTEI